jgi:hypothetical protein
MQSPTIPFVGLIWPIHRERETNEYFLTLFNPAFYPEEGNLLIGVTGRGT